MFIHIAGDFASLINAAADCRTRKWTFTWKKRGKQWGTSFPSGGDIQGCTVGLGSKFTLQVSFFVSTAGKGIQCLTDISVAAVKPIFWVYHSSTTLRLHQEQHSTSRFCQLSFFPYLLLLLCTPINHKFTKQPN